MREELESKVEELKIAFQEHGDLVSLVTALELAIKDTWQIQGKSKVALKRFERFPKLGSLRPDFLVVFDGYSFCGEAKVHMQPLPKGESDVQQVVNYASVGATDKRQGDHDVMFLVGSGSDETTVECIDQFLAATPSSVLLGNIVVIEYAWAQSTKEYINLHYRSLGSKNQRFRTPNADASGGPCDLNVYFKPGNHVPLRLDASVLTECSRQPFIQDDPPPVYTFVRLVWPTLAAMLSREEREAIIIDGHVEKAVTVEQLLSAPFVQGKATPKEVLRKRILTCCKVATKTTLATHDKKNPDVFIFKIHRRMMGATSDQKIIDQFARAVLKLEVEAKMGRGRGAEPAPAQLDLGI